MSRSATLMKLVVDADSDQVLGCHIGGPMPASRSSAWPSPSRRARPRPASTTPWHPSHRRGRVGHHAQAGSRGRGALDGRLATAGITSPRGPPPRARPHRLAPGVALRQHRADHQLDLVDSMIGSSTGPMVLPANSTLAMGTPVARLFLEPQKTTVISSSCSCPAAGRCSAWRAGPGSAGWRR